MNNLGLLTYGLSALICFIAYLYESINDYKHGRHIRLMNILICIIYPFTPVFNTIAAFILLIGIIYDNPVIIKGKKDDS